MKIAIFGAMPQEIKNYSVLKNTNSAWLKHDINISLLGVGKTSAAMNTQKVISDFKPDYVMLTGVAGALSPDLKLGDVGIVTAAIDSELDVRSWDSSYKLGEQPFTKDRVYLSDADLVNLVYDAWFAFHKPAFDAFTAFVATGSSFMDSDAKTNFVENVSPDLYASAPFFESKFPNLYDMETSAFLQVANANDIPALAIRAVSDTLEGDVASDFDKFVVDASKSYSLLLTDILRNI